MRYKKIDGTNYVIYENGEVYNPHKNRFLKQWTTNSGYKTVQMNKKTYYVHKLLAEAFIENPNNYEFVNHLDLDRLNNSIENLVWSEFYTVKQYEAKSRAHHSKTTKKQKETNQKSDQLYKFDEMILESDDLLNVLLELGVIEKWEK